MDQGKAVDARSRFWETAAAIWSAVVVALAVVPWRNVEMLTEDVSDKALHALAFVLGGLVWAGSSERGGKDSRAAGVSLVICLLMGGAIEVVQGLSTYRSAEAGDFIADTIGAMVGIALWLFTHRLIVRRESAI